MTVDAVFAGMEPTGAPLRTGPVKPRNRITPYEFACPECRTPWTHEMDHCPGCGWVAQTEPVPLPFTEVQFGDLDTIEPQAPLYAWEGLVPLRNVTLLGAHGGMGKSLIALMLAVASAVGAPLFGIPTRQSIVVYYSAEDDADRLKYQLRWVLRCMGIAPQDIADNLFLLDATTNDPTLFAEVNLGGRREGTTTPTYERLREYVADKQATLIIVDNASDTYNASEIERARVRGFVRSLASIARDRDAAVLLLAHVDKGTSRGDRQGTEGYSGSTAWNNSARSRLFMSRQSDGTLLLEQQKHNLGKLHEPIRLTWPEGRIPEADVPFGPVVQGIADRGHEKALLKLIAEFTARGEHVSAPTTSRTHAAKLLKNEPTYPKIKDAEVFALLRKAERISHLERIHVQGTNRHARECWQVTDAGRTFAGLPALTALTAPTPEVSAPGAEGAEACADCADFGAGGMGGAART